MASSEYKQLSGVTYERELEILAEVYRLALASYRRRKQAAAEPIQPSSCDDANFAGEERREHDVTDAATEGLSTQEAQ